MMNDQQFEAFIKNKGYKNSSQFNSNPKSLLRLVNYVKNLPLQQNSFDVLYDLLKFFRTPLFIACQPFYERIIKNQVECESKYINSIQQIATYVKNYLEDYNLEELKFFYAFGFSKKKKKTAQKSDQQKQFMRYIQNLGGHINKLKKQVNSKDPQQIKLQLDSILASGLERKLNVLEVHYEQYFKNEADKIYKSQLGKIQQNSLIDTIKVLQSRPDGEFEKKTPLCCRTYFYDQQNIKQPQNFTLQYKQYHFPFGQQQIRILKKTVCGFLNADGGIILLGVHQDTKTKKRKILGMQLNEAEKQNFIFSLRKDIIQSIQPDILSNKIYSVCFVPVKHRNPPHHYISGRYVAKIVIKYGLRNQIYSYRHEDRDYFAFRTENQVIHRQGRDILNAYRQRLKNPLPIPIALHDYSCPLPDLGNPIEINQMNAYEAFQDNGYQKKKYKEKDAVDFILKNITEKDLMKELQSAVLLNKVVVGGDAKKKICYLKMKENENRMPIVQFLSKLESEGNCQFFETQRALSFADKQEMEGAIQYLKLTDMKYLFNQKKNSIQFRSTPEAVEAFQLLIEKKFNINFLAK